VFPVRRASADEERWFEALAHAGRAREVAIGGATFWIATERLPVVAAAFPGAIAVGDAGGPTHEDAVTAIVRGWAECSGPLTRAQLTELTGLPPGDVTVAIGALEASGHILAGRFTPDRSEEEICDRRILARIHRATIQRLRREIEPVAPGSYLRFLFGWQHAAPGTQVRGPEGLLEVIELLAGYEAAAGTWEAGIFPSRVEQYAPSLLDRLALGGEVVWGRMSRRPVGDEAEAPRRTGVTRAAPISFGLRADLPWLLAPEPPRDAGLTSVAGAILDRLAQRGALFSSDLAADLGVLPAQVDEALGQLVAGGWVTADGFAALRTLTPRSPEYAARQSRYMRQRRFRAPSGGRWARLQALPLPEAAVLEERAAQLLRRYGILVREVLAREPLAPPWRKLLPVLRRAEARGEIRGGRFVAGLVGEQFALPEAIEAVRAVRRGGDLGDPIRIAATDPLNLSGILTKDPRIPAQPGQWVEFRDGHFVPARPIAAAYEPTWRASEP